jgi:hypothetical protein
MRMRANISVTAFVCAHHHGAGVIEKHEGANAATIHRRQTAPHDQAMAQIMLSKANGKGVHRHDPLSALPTV